jgi:hypothetical protein
LNKFRPKVSELEMRSLCDLNGGTILLNVIVDPTYVLPVNPTMVYSAPILEPEPSILIKSGETGTPVMPVVLPLTPTYFEIGSLKMDNDMLYTNPYGD